MAQKTIVGFVCWGLMLLAACSSTHYDKKTDLDVYQIISEKQAQLFKKAVSFSIVSDPTGNLPCLSSNFNAKPCRLSMADALRLALFANRDYQYQKEIVYLEALALTFERYLFQPIPFFRGKVDLADNKQTDERSHGESFETGFSKKLATGANIVAKLGLNALNIVNDELGHTVESALFFSLKQPLWRGADSDIVRENLIQAERNVGYALRNFGRYEKEFVIKIATQYLNILAYYNIAINEKDNYESLKDVLKRAKLLAQAQRMPAIEVDQTRQNVLQANNRWIEAQEKYFNSLDRFKILLGISVNLPIECDMKELDLIKKRGLNTDGIDIENAVEYALSHRLDLANMKDGLEDVKRKIVIAEDGLSGDIDIVASMGYNSDPDTRKPAKIQFQKGIYAAGFTFDLPVDRLEKRNALKRSRIEKNRAMRQLSLLKDEIRLDVKQGSRRLERIRQSHIIQKRSVKLAKSRVSSTMMLMDAGRVEQRDVLDAREALVDAKNSLTDSLVSHTIARLALLCDMGKIFVDEKGNIVEN